MSCLPAKIRSLLNGFKKLAATQLNADFPICTHFGQRRSSKGNNKIVIFPEGEISHQNEFLSDFENGSELIALSALEELKRLKLSRSIFIVPLALQYKYAHDISPDLEAALEQVEIAQGKQLQARAAIAF